MNKSILIAGLILLFMNSCNSQVYLGIIAKEGIFLNETSKKFIIQYESYQEKLNSLSYNSSDNVIFDDYRSDFKVFTNIQIGEKFYISCSENITRESVSGYIIYNSQWAGSEFYPLISNKSNLCGFNNYDHNLDYKNLTIISKDSIGENISYVPVFNKDLLKIFKQRIIQDIKNFEVYTDNINNTKEFINNIDDKDFVAFRGSFCKKYQEEYFVSYLRQSGDDFIIANYVMDSSAKVLEFFTTPRENFEYRKIIGLCDYDNDNIDEILIDVGYYEGGGYELWKYIDGKFTKVAEGFYFGV